ncbi:hypothetical protein GJA_1808 [Janthinobacterium agaricidamnosum NBRC 102515 = DSM 9628]|uniref:Uncharacterized protein n=1 Tax=Janthinobacterium agaricidamnosum NBRC 102515 = DSM 9628 TaxID=1349767 RepID=W0V0W0_9BURK|nr:hypothetical protein GJA_1808 [Janthinobacterium agaricidamnosum NBRC 102515 = DSM 9628]
MPKRDAGTVLSGAQVVVLASQFKTMNCCQAKQLALAWEFGGDISRGITGDMAGALQLPGTGGGASAARAADMQMRGIKMQKTQRMKDVRTADSFIVDI